MNLDKIKKTGRRLALATTLVASLAAATPAFAQEETKQEETQEQQEPLNLGFEVMSGLNYRGLIYSRTPMVSANWSFNKDNATAIIYGFKELIKEKDDPQRVGDFHGVVLDYTQPITDRLSVSGGISYVRFPEIELTSGEVYGTVTYANDRISSSLQVVSDFTETGGMYGQASTTANLGRGFQTRGVLGYNHNWNLASSGLSHLEVALLATKGRFQGELKGTIAIQDVNPDDSLPIENAFTAGVRVNF